jgi:hypothetical protein
MLRLCLVIQEVGMGAVTTTEGTAAAAFIIITIGTMAPGSASSVRRPWAA